MLSQMFVQFICEGLIVFWGWSPDVKNPAQATHFDELVKKFKTGGVFSFGFKSEIDFVFHET
jgi:hypothetical protein